MIDFGIIAAGDGNRIKQEGSLLPKPLVDIQGKPMIERLISIMESSGANSVSLIVNSDMPEVDAFLNTLVPSLGCELKWISKKTPSSMHSFYELLNVMKPQDKFIITTVDTIFRKEDFTKYVNAFENCSKELDGLMGVTSFIDDEKPLYVKTASDDEIVSYLDTPDDDTDLVSAGIYGLRQTSIPVLQECINSGVTRMRNFQRRLVETGLYLKAYDLGKVLDVDHLADIEKADKFLAGK